MKRYIIMAAACMAVISCQSDRTIYDGPSYIGFPEQTMVVPVADNSPFAIDVAASRTAEYDRTVGVKVVQSESNATEGKHFTVDATTVTIPAGSLSSSFNISAITDNIDESDSLVVTFSLVSPDSDFLNLSDKYISVRLQKYCPFDIDKLTDNAVVSCSFLSTQDKRQRLITTRKIDDTTLVLENFMDDGYDVEMSFDASDWTLTTASLKPGTPVGDIRKFGGSPYGDNLLRVQDYVSEKSTFDMKKKTAYLYSTFFVHGAKDVLFNASYYAVGIRWITDAEVEDIRKNGF